MCLCTSSCVRFFKILVPIKAYPSNLPELYNRLPPRRSQKSPTKIFSHADISTVMPSATEAEEANKSSSPEGNVFVLFDCWCVWETSPCLVGCFALGEGVAFVCVDCYFCVVGTRYSKALSIQDYSSSPELLPPLESPWGKLLVTFFGDF